MTTWTDCLGEYDAETTTYSALAGGAGSSPYTPTKDGRIRQLHVEIGRDAATSLINTVQFRLKCATFGGIDCLVSATGTGLQTAPAFQPQKETWEVNLPVKAGVPITIEARNVTADTPVTVSACLYATFEG